MRSPFSGRLNVLLTEDRPHGSEHWTRQLPRLLEPQGIVAHVASTGDEALTLLDQLEIHLAVIDLSTPAGPSSARARTHPSDGLGLLEVFRRLPHRPPLVVVHGPAISQRQMSRLLHDALRMGVFSVLHKPVEIEQLLVVLHRILERKYRGAWPSQPPRESWS